MNRSTAIRPFHQPVILTRCCDWPSDTVLKRRRSVLFAFTFSPPVHAH
ncbi:hypothetical protein M2D63_007010 [Pseudomonas sp. BJa5]|jgi:hypothetical protein|nr:hypothetical protein [Pseudomonas sp. BGr12]MDL2420857.1 hypothetical protein [Pseudomonas sp. BGr12]